MATEIKDGAGVQKYIKSTGVGTIGDGYIVEHLESNSTAIAASAASVDTKTPALGQALAAASVPVILPAATITTLTPPAAIAGFATEATLAAANVLLTAMQTALQLLDNAVAGNELQVDVLTLPALAAGTNNIGDIDVLTVPADPFGATADAAVTAGATGSISAKLRSISRDLIANIVLSAGENLIGKVAGTALVVTPTITVDTAVYAAGDSVGGKITLANAVRVSGGSSLLYSMHIFDRSNQKPTGNILIFNADPTAATITDNAAFVYSTDDFKQVGRILVATSDYVTVNSKASAGLTNIGRMVKAASGTSLYAVFVTDGAPDFVAATDLQIIFNFIPVD